LSKKERQEKGLFDEFEIIDMKVWWCLIGSIIVTSMIGSFISNVKLSFSQHLFSLTSISLSQASSALRHKINRNIIMFCYLFMIFILLVYYKAILLDEIMREPKTWCEDMKCFAKSDKRFYLPKTYIAFKAFSNHKDDPSYAKVLKNSFSPVEFNTKVLLDMIYGNINVIADSYHNELILRVAEYISGDSKLPVISAKSDYAIQIEMVRREHPKAENIRRKINDCLEFGIINGIAERTHDVIGNVFSSLIYTFFQDDESLMSYLKQLKSQKEMINIKNFQGIFIWLLGGCFLSCIIFLFEFVDAMLSRLLR
jgi:hypothetical protein